MRGGVLDRGGDAITVSRRPLQGQIWVEFRVKQPHVKLRISFSKFAGHWQPIRGHWEIYWEYLVHVSRYERAQGGSDRRGVAGVGGRDGADASRRLRARSRIRASFS